MRLREVSILINGDRGKNYPSKQYWIDEGIPFINAGALGEKHIDENKLNFISEERFNLLRSGFIKEGDLLYCLIGSLGKIAINNLFQKGAIASSIVIIRLQDKLDPYYFLYVLKSQIGKILINRVDNGTAQPNISAESVSNYIIPLPPLAEQKRIVEKIEELNELIIRIENILNIN